MPELHGSMPRHLGDVPEAPCVWCRRPTDLRFLPEGMPHLGPLPLHLMCGVSLIRAYERWKRGQVLDGFTMERLRALGDGHAGTGCISNLAREKA